MGLYNEYTETNVTSASAVALTLPPAPAGRSEVRIQASVTCRMRFDGVNPTISVGWLVTADSPIDIKLTEEQVRSARFIAESTSGVIRAIFI